MSDKFTAHTTPETRHRHITSSQRRLMATKRWDATVKRQKAQQIESTLDAAGVQEVRDRDWDWLDYDPAIRAETNRQLDREERMAGDGIIYESSHGAFCKCWECRI